MATRHNGVYKVLPVFVIGLYCLTFVTAAYSGGKPLHQKTSKAALPKYYFITTANQETLFTAVPTSLMNLGHGTVAWGDYDNDNRLDILMTGITDRLDSSRTDTSRHMSKIYHNEDSTFVDIDAPLAGVNNNAGTIWCDYDGDGYLDLFIGGATREPNADCVSKIYRGDGSMFIDIEASIAAVVGTAAWADVNGDGNLDLLVTGSPDNGGSFLAKLYINEQGNFVEKTTDLPGVWGASVAWGDYDNDGRPDLALVGYGTDGVTSKIFRNDGPLDKSGWIFTDISAPLALVNSGSVAWGDYDNDGFLDLLFSGDLIGPDGGFTTIYRGDGTGGFTDIHPGLIGVGNSMVSWADFDNDGDLDLLVSGQTATGSLVTTLYRNDSSVYTDIGATLQGVWMSAAAWGDYDKDGRLDLLVSGFSREFEGWPWQPITMLYHNNCPVGDSTASVPNGTASTISDSAVILRWNKAVHQTNPQNALTYNISLGMTPHSGRIVNAMSDISTGYHRVARSGNMEHKSAFTLKNLPPGTYYWQVQSVDNAHAGSAFSPVQTFTVPPPGTLSTTEIGVADKWNMVSVPLRMYDMRKDSIFHTATTPAYGFDTVYTVRDTLENRHGYWMKFDGSQSLTLTGYTIDADTFNLTAGWNLIGSISQPVPLSNIVTDPPGSRLSAMFRYAAGYVLSDTVKPGMAYWIRADNPCKLILRSAAGVAGSQHSTGPAVPRRRR